MHDNGNLHFHDGSIQMLIYFGDFPRPFLILLYYSYIFLLVNFSKIPVKFLSDGRIIEDHKMSINVHPVQASASFKQPCCVPFSPASSPPTALWLPSQAPTGAEPWSPAAPCAASAESQAMAKSGEKMSIWVIIYWGKWMIRHDKTMLIHDDPCIIYIYTEFLL